MNGVVDYYYNITNIQNLVEDFFIFISSLFKEYNKKQKTLFLHHSLQRIVEAMEHPISDEYYISLVLGKENDLLNYQHGRYIFHWLDFYVLDLLSLVVSHDLIQPFSEILTDQQRSLIRMIYHNALRIMACDSYYYSLGSVRFTRQHSLLVVYDRIYTYGPPTYKSCLFAIEAALLFLPSEEVVETTFNIYSNGIAIKLDDHKEEQAVGIHLMLSYLLFMLIAVVYNRSYIHHNRIVLLK